MIENEDNLKDLRDLLLEGSTVEEHEEYSKIFKDLGIDLEELSELNSKINLEYSSEDNKILSYAYPSDSGFDLYASEEVHLSPFGRALVPTGVRINIPENYEIQIRSKSGLAINKGLMVLNSPGTVDQGYTGEIKVIIFNTSDLAQTIEKGTKVAQAVLSMCISGRYVDLIKVEEINSKDRNENGFGSTGV
jgi:dUTP pyrophosphatase